MPTRSASITIPLQSVDGRSHDFAVATIPVRELESRMEWFHLEQLAFYARGREPVPYRVLTGTAGERYLELVVGVAGDGSTSLLAVCPGPTAGSPPLASGTLPRAEPHFRDAHR